jgi:NitT/TauT family transport system ATP-binding protein
VFKRPTRTSGGSSSCGAKSAGASNAFPANAADVSTAARLSLRNITHVFYDRNGRPIPAVRDISLDLKQGDFIAVVGPSGCGKSTILNIAAGLLSPRSGQVFIDGRPETGTNPAIGYMPSSDALLPWRTAIRNAEYGLEIRGVPNRRAIAKHWLDSVGLSGCENLYVNELSRGMRQRVAMARTFASSPSILLMDEPFSAIDAQTKVTLHELFLNLWEQERKTVLLVTHDVAEAISLADKVLVLTKRPAEIKSVVQIDLPRPRSIQSLVKVHEFQELLGKIWTDLQAGEETSSRVTPYAAR